MAKIIETEAEVPLIFTGVDGQKLERVRRFVLPIPETEIVGELLYSQCLFIQIISMDNGKQNFYIRDTTNPFFVRKLELFQNTFSPSNGSADIDYTLLGSNFHREQFTVGIDTNSGWQFSLQHDGAYDWADLSDTQRSFLESASPPHLDLVRMA